ncbi:glycosyltransferase family A protein [Kiritimatiellaeota bacterium B1221]|nr:glycosyltransferase family A protein [Kiritimatiellaeota bacterium B1221]
MKISLGVLAHNEESGIESTLEDLLKQDLWNSDDHQLELWVVVNGSTDRTADLANKKLAQSTAVAKVIELTRPGKANAWNQFIHDLSPEDTELFFLADADILLPRPDALRLMLEELLSHPAAVAVVDVPVKDLAGNSHQGAASRLSLSASALASAGPPKLCGQLYAARATAMRKIFLPEPLLVEDGFIKAMLVTDAFTQPEDLSRLVRADGVYHIYEAETAPGSIYKHEKRILIGSLCNFILFDRVRQTVETGHQAGPWLREKMEEDPDWFRKLIQETFRKSFIPKGIGTMVWVPFRQWRMTQGRSRIKSLPAMLIRTLLNFLVACGATFDIRKGRFFW